jgi:hypothetical protein
MKRTSDDIEGSLIIPANIASPLLAYAQAQDATRGEWASQRGMEQPDGPWPDVDNPALQYLLHKFHASIEAGMDTEVAALQLAVHCWYESGIDNYDRGQSDARRI